MNKKIKKFKVGIIGCGAIGSRMAQSVKIDLKKYCELSGIYDIATDKSFSLATKLRNKKLIKSSLANLIKSSDLLIEAVSSKNTAVIIREVITNKKDILVMSVGVLLQNKTLIQLANKNNCSIIIPSGAIAGIDAIKSASLVGIKEITLTTRKPPEGLLGNNYLIKNGIDLTKIKKETLCFSGSVSQAVNAFPQNINVAAILALASNHEDKIKIKIISSPKFKTNSHEIEVLGEFGKLITKTENLACPDNPKTSYLAVLSGIQTLKQYCTGIQIGT